MINSKTCGSCKETKDYSEFNKNKTTKDGYHSACRSCKKAQDKAYREANKESISESKKIWYSNNKEHCYQKSKEWVKNNPDARKATIKRYYENHQDAILERQAEYREANREVCNLRIKSWAERNTDKVRAKDARRRALLKQAQPLWLTKEQNQQIECLYLQAWDCEIITGERYEVDHIVPLQGKNVCGLHVPWNLQVLPADINRRKSNKHGSGIYS